VTIKDPTTLHIFVKYYNLKLSIPTVQRKTKTEITRMRGKAQPDGRPALQIIETPFLL